jgi:hypothetical protein
MRFLHQRFSTNIWAYICVATHVLSNRRTVRNYKGSLENNMLDFLADVPSIIFRTAAAIWSKTNSGPAGHHHPRSSPLTHVSTVPSASAIFKCILQVVFCEGVQHRLRFCLDHLNCVKMAAFGSIFNWGNRDKYGWWGTKVMLFWSKTILWKKEVWDGALSWCNGQFFCRQSSGRSLRTFSHSRRKTLQ